MKTVIFDFDGVIHNTFELAYEIQSNLIRLTRDEYKDLFNGNILDNKDVIANKDEFFRRQNEMYKFLTIDDDVKKGLERLAAAYDLFVISSNHEEALDNYFQNNDATHIFKEVLGTEKHLSKVEKFKYLFEKYGLQADDCVFITDTLGDILEGHKVGIRTIAVDWGFHDQERLEKGKPYRIVSNFSEISDILASI